MGDNVEHAVRSSTVFILEKHRPSRERGDSAFDQGNYFAAREAYISACYALLDDENISIPLEAEKSGGGRQWQPYISPDPLLKTFLMMCYNQLARCAIAINHSEEALTWLEEARVVWMTTRFSLSTPLFEWIRHNIALPQLTKELVTAHALASDVFELLGNTSMAVDRRYNIGVESIITPEATRIRDTGKLFRITSLRHPDPSLTASARVTSPELQVMGTWRKVHVRKKGPMKPRLGFAGFIWNGKLYIGGGLGETKGPFYRDFCCLDLAHPTTWRALPAFPQSENRTGVWLCWSFAVHEATARAYLFTGTVEVDYFDLVAEKWRTVQTHGLREASRYRGIKVFEDNAPLCGFKDSTQQVVGDFLYVFGGTHHLTKMGSNLFLQLNLKTMVWRRLSGEMTAGEKADYTCPGPRKTPSSWVDGKGERFYLIGGEMDRSGGQDMNERHAADCGYAYEDLWSFDLKEEKWRNERLVGNVPCPRSEAACVYNPKLDKAIVFGGYNPAFGTQFENNFFPFAYFADTFMFCPNESRKWSVPPPSEPASNSKIFSNPKTAMSTAQSRPSTTGIFSTPVTPTSILAPSSAHPESTAKLSKVTNGKWKHVLTRGFPTYRAQSLLLVDPATGKTYLFGGYVNTDWVPSGRPGSSRTFCDLWELRVDVRRIDGQGEEEEGWLEAMGEEERERVLESRTARVGPWQRCFACGSAGRWKKCGDMFVQRSRFLLRRGVSERWMETA
ncbi:unnamed protein product [Cyclocybe aegerita]|uniref:Kelch repeat-containing protein n=1 Tax=Cyclocybe aegerita TaxID=1973307 RepID=A0A8S0WTP6_CYCAE|nr:unnamed protein product [Cyclocybe aegerita]